MPLRATIASAAALAAGCLGGVTPSQCAIDSDCPAPAFCAEGVCLGGTRSCPALQATFSSINMRFLQVGCGVRQTNCHGVDSSSVKSGPSFAGKPYALLVNAPAANHLGSARDLILVKPFDPDHSFLLLKLRLTAIDDPQYGNGQPAPAPGSTCPEAVAAIAEWIRAGAPDN